MKYTYRTKGTCCSSIELEVEDDLIKNASFHDGCNGNLKGISGLIIGMKVTDVIAKLEGIPCKSNPTSCPDQLCKALHKMGY
ncbi:hypothetical protein EZS27_036700 [termite gut metagenome]|uniref:ribonucleoside-diphosphate reductase n=1 Tax=termite gut metagenome TaxID=433724 RepID=A0A5J4PVM6_9ZZZZ